MADIFLSYAEEDRETARRLAGALEAAGRSVWWDRRIPAGMTWRQVIQKALDDMGCMVVLWSASSVASAWVAEEAEEARTRGKLVPVLIEPVVPPLGFRAIQAADMTHWDGTREAAGFRQLLADLALHLAPTPSPPLAPVAASAEMRAAVSDLRVPRIAVTAGALAVVAALAAWAWIARDGRAPERPVPSANAVSEPGRASLLEAAPAPLIDAPGPRAPRMETAPPAAGAPAAVPERTDQKSRGEAPTPLASAESGPAASRSARTDRKPGREPRPARCRDILERQGLGDPLSTEERAFWRKECVR